METEKPNKQEESTRCLSYGKQYRILRPESGERPTLGQYEKTLLLDTTKIASSLPCSLSGRIFWDFHTSSRGSPILPKVRLFLKLTPLYSDLLQSAPWLQAPHRSENQNTLISSLLKGYHCSAGTIG